MREKGWELFFLLTLAGARDCRVGRKENKKKKKEKRENLKPDDDNVQKMNFGRGRRDWRARSFRGFVFEGGRKRKGRVGDVCGRKSDEI